MGTHLCTFSNICRSWSENFCCFWIRLVVIKFINLFCIKIFKFQIFRKRHPNKSKGELRTTAFNLAPQSKTTTVCLVFCFDPSPMPGPRFYYFYIRQCMQFSFWSRSVLFSLSISWHPACLGYALGWFNTVCIKLGFFLVFIIRQDHLTSKSPINLQKYLQKSQAKTE